MIISTKSPVRWRQFANRKHIVMEIGLRGKRALITGGASGIGQGIVKALADHGVDVVLTYVSSAHGAQETVAYAHSRGVKAVAYQADLTDEASVNRVVADTQSFLGGIDIMVTNAGGILGRKQTTEITRQTWDDAFALNVTSTFLCCKAVIPGMIAQGGGNIVMMSSQAAFDGGGVGSTYSSARVLRANSLVRVAEATELSDQIVATREFRRRLERTVLELSDASRVSRSDAAQNGGRFAIDDDDAFDGEDFSKPGVAVVTSNEAHDSAPFDSVNETEGPKNSDPAVSNRRSCRGLVSSYTRAPSLPGCSRAIQGPTNRSRKEAAPALASGPC